MFNRLFESSKKQEVFFDIEEGTEDAPFLKVVIDETEEKFEDVPEAKPIEAHQPKFFLADEIQECIDILNKAKTNGFIKREKLEEVQKYWRLIYLAQLALSLGASGSTFAAITHFSQQWSHNKEDETNGAYKESQEKETLLKQSTNTLQEAMNHSLIDDQMPVSLSSALVERFSLQKEWWRKSSDDHTAIDDNDVLYNASSWSLEYNGYCNTWRKQNSQFSEIKYISSLWPEFKNTDFCWLINHHETPFDTCNIISTKICALDEKIESLMQEDSSLAKFNHLLDSQREISQLEFEINQLRATAQQETSFILNPYTYCYVGAALALVGCLATLTYKFKKAYGEYKQELEHVHDLDRCVSDPKILNRLINLTARLNISMKDATIDTLITALKNSLNEVVERRWFRLELGFFYGAQIKAHLEKLERLDQGVWKDVVPLILEHTDYSPKLQAPRSRCSSSD